MDITPNLHEQAQLIERYGGGSFVVAGHRYASSLLVMPSQCQPIAATSVAALDEAMFTPAFEAEEPTEIVILGTGAKAEMPPLWLRQQCEARQIGFEAMDTGAACRTFNVLLSEARRVAAVLIAA